MRKLFVSLVLVYLRICAKIQLAKIKPFIIGVGGSSGKSSVCELLQGILSYTFVVKQSKGKNSETGIPLDVLSITMKNYAWKDWIRAMVVAFWRLITDWKKYDIYIVEMGIDSPVEPKNMSYLLKIIKPHMSVVTNVALEHSVYFDDFVKESDPIKREEAILRLTADQETLLLRTLSKKDTVIINLDDTLIRDALPLIKAKSITVSAFDSSAKYFISRIQTGLSGFRVEFSEKGKPYSLALSHPLPKHFAYSFILSIAVARQLGISVEKSIFWLEQGYVLPPGRMSVFDGIKDTTIIDSSYNNGTITPIIDVLQLLKTIPKTHRTVVIIGDMRELGSQSKATHELVARKILESADIALLIGPLMREYVAPILEKSKFPCKSFLSVTQANQTILSTIQPHDVILVKGSQNTLFLERIVEMLLENPKDAAKLCRRGDFWDEIRSKTP